MSMGSKYRMEEIVPYLRFAQEIETSQKIYILSLS